MALFDGHGMAFVIEGFSVKMLVFSGKKIESWYSAPLNANWVKEGLVASPEYVGGIMADLVREKRMPRSGVLAALPSAGSGNQVLSLPSMGRLRGRKLNEVVHRELRRVMPGSAEVDYIYSQLLQGNGVKQKQKVFALAVPRVNVMSMVETSHAAGISMKALELRPFALARAVGCKSGIIVHGEVDSIEVVVIDKSLPALFRHISIKETVANAVPTVETAFQILFRDLPTTIEYYVRMNPDNTSINSETPVYFSGNLSVEYDAGKNLETATGRQVSSVEPPLECPANFPLAQYLVNVGLMMKGKW